MVFVRCDRCGKIVEKRTIIFNQTDSDTQEEISQAVGVPMRHWDLCNDCWDSYCKWLLNEPDTINESDSKIIPEIEVVSVNESIPTDITEEKPRKKNKK